MNYYLVKGIELKVDDIVLFKKKHYDESYEARITHIFRDNTVRVDRGSNSTIVSISEIEEIVKQDKQNLVSEENMNNQFKIGELIIEEGDSIRTEGNLYPLCVVGLYPKVSKVKVFNTHGEDHFIETSTIIEIIKAQPKAQEDKKATAASTKPQLQLIPACFSEELARVMQNGKEKYGERNWITGDGVSLQTYLGAILRHTNKIISGEDIDPESGLEHAAHIAASCAIILDAKQCGKLKDDRILPKCYDLPNPGSPIRD